MAWFLTLSAVSRWLRRNQLCRGFLHRLDVPSSGLILAAKSFQSFYDLQVSTPNLGESTWCCQHIIRFSRWDWSLLQVGIQFIRQVGKFELPLALRVPRLTWKVQLVTRQVPRDTWQCSEAGQPHVGLNTVEHFQLTPNRLSLGSRGDEVPFRWRLRFLPFFFLFSCLFLF